MKATTASQSADLVQRILKQPARSITGLVDDLLAVCREHELELDWQPDRLRLRSQRGEWEELSGAAIGRSEFRAALARVAVLCNERAPSSVSPYGGEGELAVGVNPTTVFRVRFSNTPEEQKLEMAPQAMAGDGAPG